MVFDIWREVQKVQKEDNALCMKLKGAPWGCPGAEDKVHNNMLVMKMVQVMANYGWILYSATIIDARTGAYVIERVNQKQVSLLSIKKIFKKICRVYSVEKIENYYERNDPLFRSWKILPRA